MLCCYCKVIYKVKPYLEKTSKYCSRSCKAKAERIQLKAPCGFCGKEFEHISSRVNKAKYCSKICYHRSQIGKGSKQFNCLYCNKIFFDSNCKKRKYCSIQCVKKPQREVFSPKYSTVRKKMIKENMINKCEKCNYDEVIDILGIHHKDGNRKNNKKENLMVLCPMCHSLIHNKHIAHCNP